MKTYLRMTRTLSALVLALFLIAACATAPTPIPGSPTSSPITPTSTLIPPTAIPTPSSTIVASPTASVTPMPRTSTPTPPTAIPIIARKDERGFSILETAHAIIFAQPGISDNRAQDVGKQFEIAYQIIATDLAPAEQRPHLYVYRSEDELFQDLTTTWKYDTWFTIARAYPRMNRDYIAWIPPLPRGDIAFITHEYTHRIIEQIAGINSQINYKWFDEGLAEYAGLQALAQQSAGEAQAKRQEQIDLVARAQKTNALIRFRELTTEDQFRKMIERDWRLAYAQSSVAVDYLIAQFGIAQIKNVLGVIRTGSGFPDAFQKVYGFTVDEFEKRFFEHIAKLDRASDAATCFTIDGQAGDWQKLKPLIVDTIYAPIARAADVREVFAVTCNGALYLLIAVDGNASADERIAYAFEVDTNGDEIPEFQPGFDRARAWVWNLKGTGYADLKQNMLELTDRDFRLAIGQVIEFMLPLRLIDNAARPRIRVYTFVSGQMANRRTAWGTVAPLE
ncbi:MAG: hypothetical protein HZC40_02455 [Chloroflexi bacterium]|nr:hypothetical protein [Chloroflexota bacterium]